MTHSSVRSVDGGGTVLNVRFSALLPSGSMNTVQSSQEAPTGSADMPTDQELMDEKLKTIEARTETRLVELSGKMDRVIDSIANLNTHVSDELGFVKTELSAVKSDNKWTRWTIIIAVITSLIGGIAALWVTQSNLLASFSAGIAVHEATKATTPSSNSK